jgi:signal transduction histidine kinase
MRALRLTDSVAARLALGNGLLLIVVIGLISAVFYFGTVGVLARSMDGKIIAISNRLTSQYAQRPIAELVEEINHELLDGIDSDTEIFLVTAPDGHRLAGNLSTWPTGVPVGQLLDGEVIRDERPSYARLLLQRLPDGGMFYVGRDLSEQRAIRQLVLRALESVMAVSLVVVALGALLLRHQIERRIGGIRHTAREIESGNLQQRIAVSGDDEFARLGIDINRMLDRIEQLMNGVRHVSNTIAHDLRTPMGRLRARLDEALRRDAGLPALTDAARGAIEGIDDLIVMLNKILRIAEAESGVRADTFERVNLNSIVHDMAELYDAAAEQAGVRLAVLSHDAVWAHGDHDLLANAVASLIDNALKYAGRGAVVDIAAGADAQRAFITVRDNGPGVAASELPRLTERFYRVDRARNQPGNGLGLSIVAATATLHGGSFELSNADPGLRATLRLPHAGSPGLASASGARTEANAAEAKRWTAQESGRRAL